MQAYDDYPHPTAVIMGLWHDVIPCLAAYTALAYLLFGVWHNM